MGESVYSHFLDPDANVIDDTLVYRRGEDKYLVVVNASNDDKDHTWFESVRDGKVCIDNARPWARTYGYQAEIRNLRDPKPVLTVWKNAGSFSKAAPGSRCERFAGSPKSS